tara:strand:- start:354 stop:875 length:522 start_codon:yes stop_codon:yes gene_type:complete
MFDFLKEIPVIGPVFGGIEYGMDAVGDWFEDFDYDGSELFDGFASSQKGQSGMTASQKKIELAKYKKMMNIEKLLSKRWQQEGTKNLQASLPIEDLGDKAKDTRMRHKELALAQLSKLQAEAASNDRADKVISAYLNQRQRRDNPYAGETSIDDQAPRYSKSSVPTQTTTMGV